MVWGTFVVLFVVLHCQPHCLISKLIISMNGWLETTSFRRHYNYNNYNIHGLRYFVVPQKFIPCQRHSLTNQLRISMNCWKPPVLDVITIIYMCFSSPPTAAATQTTQIRSVQLKSDTNVLVKCLKSCTFWNVVLFKCLKCCTFWNPTQFWGTSTICSCTIYTITICSHPNPSISQNFCTTCTRCRYLPFISNTTKLSFTLNIQYKNPSTCNNTTTCACFCRQTSTSYTTTLGGYNISCTMI